MTQTLPPRETNTCQVHPLGPGQYVTIPATARLAADPQLAPIGAAELARLAAGQTLVLPTDAQPAPHRASIPTTYGTPATDGGCRCCGHERKPLLRRGERRRRLPLHTVASAVVGLTLAAYAGGWFSHLLLSAAIR